MLATLYIENIAVIEKSNINFKPGLNILTGETGAGKSIVIDAINAVLGKRTTKEIIRTGASSAFVSAVFESIPKTAVLKISECGFNPEEGQLIIQRELTAAGRNNCRINGRPVPVSVLREISIHLISIYGQNESYDLTLPELHINYIDDFCGNKPLLEKYNDLFKEYKTLASQLNAFDMDDGVRLQKIDLLKYQTEEIKDACLQIDEQDRLRKERTVLINSERISGILSESKLLLAGDDEINGAVLLVENAAEALRSAVKIFPEIEKTAARIYDIFYDLKDCQEEIEACSEGLESNPKRLNEIEERLDVIYRLTKKYGPSVLDVLSFCEKSEQKLQSLLDYDTNRGEMHKKVLAALNETKKIAQRLSENRKKAIARFEVQVKGELEFLDMPKVTLKVEQKQTELNERGFDKIEMLISANPGQAPKPVSKIASGGELSRIMLAIKTVLSQSDNTVTMIFDEIDSGISGLASQKVGMKLCTLSNTHQVICVTHQAQIAAFADSHYLIQKAYENDKTYTKVLDIPLKERKNELARIVSGSKANDAALSFADELIKKAEAFKKNL